MGETAKRRYPSLMIITIINDTINKIIMNQPIPRLSMTAVGTSLTQS